MTKARVLVIEGEMSIARDLEARLTRLGYNVSGIAMTAAEAIQRAEETRPDVVLMDIVLRGADFDGIQTANRIHQQFGLPVIFVMAHSDESMLQRAKMTEPFGYIINPFSETELIATIEMARKEAKLRRVERWIANRIKEHYDAVLATDINGQIIFMNPVAEALSGWRRHEAFGKSVREVFKILDASTRAPREDVAARVLREGIVIDLQANTLLVTQNGDEIPIDDVAAPIRDDRGNITGVVLVFRDIGGRRPMEGTLRQLRERLFQMQKMESMGTLAGGIAHHFNNILTGIMGYTEMLLLKMGRTHDLAPYPERVLAQCAWARDLVKQLLMFSNPTAVETERCDLGDLLNDFSALLRPTMPERIEIKSQSLSEPIFIEVNRSQLQQVLLNLAINARDAIPEGGRLQIETMLVWIHEGDVQGRADVKPGQFARITVSDTGRGIPPQILASIFEPFFTTKEVGKGTGLGLSVAYGIIKAHGGWIEVESEVGQGTSFHIHLPIAEGAAGEMAKAEDEEIIGGSETILLAEDEPAVLDLGCQFLGSLGYRVLAARDGREAVESYTAHRDEIDLVLLDMMMPHLTGEQVFEKLRELNSRVKVLLVTGSSSSEVTRELVRQGAVDIVEKPYALKVLARAVRNSLSRS